MAVPNWGGSIHGDRNSMGINNMSAIVPDESNDFLSNQEHNAIFGTGNIGPDRIRMSMAKVIQGQNND